MSMLTYPQIDPVIFQIGPLAPRWYGMMYLIGFVFTFRRLKKYWQWLGLKDPEQVDNIMGIMVLSMLLCSRLVYVTFYNLEETLSGPWWEVFAVWHGGLAFHGGLAGIMIGAAIVCRKYKLSWLRLVDVLSTVGPVGLGLGRIGNFINGELWGRVSDVPWAMIFPGAGPYPRHPSQLYQSFFEGLVLYLVVNAVWKRKPTVGYTAATLLLAYAVVRIAMEFFREPDAQLGFIVGGLTMGQLLSFAMIIAAALVFRSAKKIGQKH
jgi:phosphatidylglycerol:prolipoprotein diacylglycerol transferase